MRVLKLYHRQYAVCAVCDNRGDSKLLDFLEGLGNNLQSNRRGMLNLLERCAQSGAPRNTDICHELEDGIWELIKGKLRVLYFCDKGKLLICTHGFVKKSRKTPKREIAAAQRDRARYFAAKEQSTLEFIEERNDG